MNLLEQDRVTVVRDARRRPQRRLTRLVAALVAILAGAFVARVLLGDFTITIPDFFRIVRGEQIPGATFILMEDKLPRAILGVMVGVAFGSAGAVFQSTLRNPLASPDIIGITAGASTAATFAIVFLSLSGTAVSVVAIVAGLGVAAVVYLLSFKDGVAGTRLILIGIGIAAMLESATAYILDRAPEWDFQEAMRWLTGSLNAAGWADVVPVAAAICVLGPFLLAQMRNLEIGRLGDDAASALGVRVERMRVVVVVAAVGLIAFATAATGPIAFVAFLSGPIAARIVGPNGSMLLPSALVGALLVLCADFCGQFLLGTRFPVGVVTGVLGAPYLIYLIVRTNRTGGTL